VLRWMGKQKTCTASKDQIGSSSAYSDLNAVTNCVAHDGALVAGSLLLLPSALVLGFCWGLVTQL
jgi:hypothetical protein